MWPIGYITMFRAALLIIVQILKLVVAATLVSVLFPGGLNISTTLTTITSIVQAFFI
jgi:hypothetical protein